MLFSTYLSKNEIVKECSVVSCLPNDDCIMNEKVDQCIKRLSQRQQSSELNNRKDILVSVKNHFSDTLSMFCFRVLNPATWRNLVIQSTIVSQNFYF